MNKLKYILTIILTIIWIIPVILIMIPIRSSTSPTFVVVKKNIDSTIIANITDISYFDVETNTFSKWTVINQTMDIGQVHQTNVNINGIYQIITTYDIYGFSLSSSLYSWW